MIKTKRWNDPVEPDDGFRVLVTRYRPRGIKKADETWDVWVKELSPSIDLHADAYGKRGQEIDFPAYRRRYLSEMAGQQTWIESLARRVRDGETITLLCSSACTHPAECHRTLLKALVEETAAQR